MPSSSVSSNSLKNSLLAQLPQSDYEKLKVHLRFVELPYGEVLYEVGQKIDRIYFPTAGMVSLVLTDAEGHDVEAGIVAHEGLTGIDAVLSDDPAGQRSVVQIKGSALAIPIYVLKEEMEKSRALQKLVLRYTKTLLAQTAQCVLCQASHNIEERMCRWMLTVADRVGSEEFDITQDFIATMLGARRSTVTVVAGSLRAAGMLDYSYGHIRLLDRPALEAATCECYKVIRNGFDRLTKN